MCDESSTSSDSELLTDSDSSSENNLSAIMEETEHSETSSSSGDDVSINSADVSCEQGEYRVQNGELVNNAIRSLDVSFKLRKC